MTKQLAPIQALLLFALAWGFLLVLLSFFMPVVTVMSSHDGLQPRVSTVQAYGLDGVLPAMGILVAVVLTASLLAFGRHAPSRASLTSAEGIAGLVLMVGLLAPLVFHIPGLFALPLAIAVATAAVTSEVLRQSA